jgi:evolutionarily conserved signaling intermediate in Toll pathway
MMYWMPKFKNLSPWLLPFELPNDAMELAKLAIRQVPL